MVLWGNLTRVTQDKKKKKEKMKQNCNIIFIEKQNNLFPHFKNNPTVFFSQQPSESLFSFWHRMCSEPVCFVLLCCTGISWC